MRDQGRLPCGSVYVDSSLKTGGKIVQTHGKAHRLDKRKHTLGQMSGLLLWYEEPLLPCGCLSLEFLAQVILRMAMEYQPPENLRCNPQPSAEALPQTN